ncbi:DUF397 domain-containing protein [Streptomyces sp. NPDC088745]|uniref:DUF397 domain-containing protein n=1 Tax=Streptomyces sp. NPDC088745 TaxID=3365884 RepID=UPI00381FE367
MTHAPAPSAWITSSYSAAQNECVQVRASARTVEVRDSKHTALPHVRMAPTAFGQFVTALRHGNL